MFIFRVTRGWRSGTAPITTRKKWLQSGEYSTVLGIFVGGASADSPAFKGACSKWCIEDRISMPQIHGGFEGIRDEVDGHPMRNLFAYVLRYWKRLVPAIIASFIMRIARLVPALAIAAAIDRVLSASGGPAYSQRSVSFRASRSRPEQPPSRSACCIDSRSSLAAHTYCRRWRSSPHGISSKQPPKTSKTTSDPRRTTICNVCR